MELWDDGISMNSSLRPFLHTFGNGWFSLVKGGTPATRFEADLSVPSPPVLDNLLSFEAECSSVYIIRFSIFKYLALSARLSALIRERKAKYRPS